MKISDVIFMGVDFARFGNDYNAIVWARWNQDTKQITVLSYEKVDSKNRLMHIVGKIVRYAETDERIVKIVTDDNGIGGGPTDALIERLGHRRVIGISNQKRGQKEFGWKKKLMKEDMYTTLKLAMEEGRVRLPDKPPIIKSLRQLRQKYSKDGDTMIHGKDDHIAEALVRACYLPLSGMVKGYGKVYLLRM